MRFIGGADNKMKQALTGRGRLNLLLDLVFAGWCAYIVISGALLPAGVVDLLRKDPPAIVSAEPLHAPDESIIEVVPGTYSPGSLASQAL